jgi:hypothetical protein
VPYQEPYAALLDHAQQQRIKNLRLPSLNGRSVLNVNCADGLYCGYALFDQAREVVGVEGCQAQLAQAQQRYPQARFHRGDGHDLPAGLFDVVIVTIQSGEIEAQRALVDALMARLKPGGTLTLEILAPTPRPAQGHKMAIRPLSEDEQALVGHAWKLLGMHLDPESGQPAVSVYQLRHKMPLVYLLLNPPGYGKTTIARSMFKDPATPLVSLDKLLVDIAGGHFTADAALTQAISQDFHPHRIGSVIDKLFAAGLQTELLKAAITRSGGKDFALDGYVPAAKVPLVRQAFSELGYVPVLFDWQPTWDLPVSASSSEQKLEAYQRWLAALAKLPPSPGNKSLPGEVRGHIDACVWQGQTLTVKGWVASRRGERINTLKVEVAGQTHWQDNFQRIPRADVQKHLDHFDAELGFSFSVSLPRDLERAAVLDALKIYAGANAHELHGPLVKNPHLLSAL